ncbi:MAG TPA: substrate-binding domain-containing protein [Polyangiaceae bacterium]|nr:substrate-binding domain-containing protein [Polyangiaceae bacterium]
MEARRVLVVLNTDAAWSRGILRGFMAAAHEHDWMLLHYNPSSSLNWIAGEWAPAAAVVGPELSLEALAELAPAALVSVTVDRTAHGVASVCLDEEAIAAAALQHLLAAGLRRVSTFRYDESPFAVARESAFIERARAAGAKVVAGWGSDENVPPQRHEDRAAMVAWLRSLPKPCGIFTCTDGWGRAVARYARAARLRVPEDLALVGADNDVLECELISPPLSSVIIPWREVGKNAAKLVHLALSGRAIEGKRSVVSPVGVMARRSSDVLAVDDAVVAKAVRWIRANADRRLTVTMVAGAVGGGRQRLERRFRAVLDRTIQEEIRRTHLEAATRLLTTTRAGLPDIAKRSGFTNAALLNAAFRRELGTTPGAYRRRVQKELSDPDDG